MTHDEKKVLTKEELEAYKAEIELCNYMGINKLRMILIAERLCTLVAKQQDVLLEAPEPGHYAEQGSYETWWGKRCAALGIAAKEQRHE